jgi:uncharacterized protein
MTESDLINLKQGLEHDHGFIELKETHISWVLITDKYAYKIKKPTKTSFLDFSSQQKRAFYCQEEVRLNQRFSPEIYLGVCYVNKKDKKISISDTIENKEEIIDHAVKMHALPSENLLSTLLENDKVSETHIINISKKIAAYHQKETSIGIAPNTQELKEDFNDILLYKDAIHSKSPLVFHFLIDEMIAFSDNFLIEHKNIFQERATKGFYKDLHGDLHTGNIFILNDQPVLFDCIEFNDRFRKIDILHEIAFLSMDLDVRGFKNFSQLFINQYLNIYPCIKTDQEKALFNYYKIYKANVRLKIEAIANKPQDSIIKYLQILSRYLHKKT